MAHEHLYTISLCGLSGRSRMHSNTYCTRSAVRKSLASATPQQRADAVAISAARVTFRSSSSCFPDVQFFFPAARQVAGQSDRLETKLPSSVDLSLQEFAAVVDQRRAKAAQYRHDLRSIALDQLFDLRLPLRFAVAHAHRHLVIELHPRFGLHRDDHQLLGLDPRRRVARYRTPYYRRVDLALDK